MEKVAVFAPGSIGNIGPGFDVLGLAVESRGDIVVAERTGAGGVVIESIGGLEGAERLPMDPDENTAGMAAVQVHRRLGSLGGVSLRLIKGLPAGSGLGSSASSAVAGAWAVNLLFGAPLPRDEILYMATVAEARVSGGFFADNTAPSLFGGATLTRSSEPLDVIRLGAITGLVLVIVTPKFEILTRKAREILPEKIRLTDFVSNMANACLMVAAFTRNDYDLFARCLVDRVIEPVRAELIPGFYKVKRAAMEAGAAGCTISGAGPSMFAATSDPKAAEAIRDAMVSAFTESDIPSEGFITRVDLQGARSIDPESV